MSFYNMDNGLLRTLGRVWLTEEDGKNDVNLKSSLIYFVWLEKDDRKLIST